MECLKHWSSVLHELLCLILGVKLVEVQEFAHKHRDLSSLEAHLLFGVFI
jgi:hypothetical protein